MFGELQGHFKVAYPLDVSFDCAGGDQLLYVYELDVP